VERVYLSEAARLMAGVFLPTPPFWLAIVLTLPRGRPRFTWNIRRVFGEYAGPWSMCFTWNISRFLPIVVSLLQEGEKCFTWNTLKFVGIILRL
jgi:hypothetical protein